MYFLGIERNITGVFYFKRYIETLSMENRFCRMFPEEDIQKLLITHGRIHQIDYSKIIINIFELVLNTVFFAVLSGENSVTLGMTDTKYQVLAEKLNGVTPEIIDMMTDEGIKWVIHDLEIKEQALSDYIQKYKDTLK